MWRSINCEAISSDKPTTVRCGLDKTLALLSSLVLLVAAPFTLHTENLQLHSPVILALFSMLMQDYYAGIIDASLVPRPSLALRERGSGVR